MKLRWVEGIIHILFWVSTGWLIISGFSIQSHEIEVVNDMETVIVNRNVGLIYQLIGCILVSIVLFYLNTWIVLKQNKVNAKSPILYSAFILMGVLVVIYLGSESRFFDRGPSLPIQISSGIVIFYFSISIAYSLLKILINHHQREQQLLVDKKQAELTLLRNQLQPHFLFNAINNLLSMVNPTDNPKLANSFDRLSKLLRYVIEENHTDKVKIWNEIDFLKNYIDLQLLRFNDGEVNVNFVVEGPYDNHPIEPGLFIAFVENAFKYGTEPEKTATIDINFDLTNPNEIHFFAKNNALMTNNNGPGTGIESTQKRLALIYPQKHQLSISHSDEFIIRLTINTQ